VVVKRWWIEEAKSMVMDQWITFSNSLGFKNYMLMGLLEASTWIAWVDDPREMNCFKSF